MKGQRIQYSDEELAFVKEKSHLSRREIAARFAKTFDRIDVTEDNIKSLCSRNGWSAGKAGKQRAKGKSLVFSAAQVAWIKDHASLSGAVLETRFCAAFPNTDLTLDQIVGFKKRNGIKTGRTGQFEKGGTPANKGKKMPFNANRAKSQFKSGHQPANYKGPGHEMICPKDGYLYLIVAETNPHTGADTRRVLKHKWLWEKTNGPVPDGHCLKCIDSDKTNTDISNWLAVPRGLLPLLNSRWKSLRYEDAEPEIKPYILAAARLKHAAKTAKSRHSERTQPRATKGEQD
jgi:hypothetical protein